MRSIFILIVIGFTGWFSFHLAAQAEEENHLSLLLSAMRSAKGDEAIAKANNEFLVVFERALQKDWAFDYPFSALNSIGKITSQDKEVRIISWNVNWESDTHSYFAFVLKKDKRGNGHTAIYLKDNGDKLPPQPTEMLDEENWYGALYYDIIDVQKGKKTYYTLLGYDAKNNRSTVKLIDVLHFAGTKPRFGYPLFETENGTAKRVFFEHAAKTVMTLRFDKERQMIVFDHLSPEAPGLAEFREYYVPDMSYDAYRFEGNKWKLYEDIIANNAPENRDKLILRKYDAENDSIVEVTVKSKWIDPTDRSAPVAGNVHKAAVPDDSDPKNPSGSKEVVSKDKKKKSNYQQVTFTDLQNNKKKKVPKKKR